jgi:hypothetical protein
MTAVTAAEDAEPRIQVGWVVESSLRVVSRRAVDLVLLALPFVVLPDLLIELLPADLRLLRAFAGVPGAVFVGGATLITFNELTGRERMSFGRLALAGIRRFVTLWLISAVKTVAVGLGLILLVVPGLILLMAWMPATAIAMVERKGSTAALVEAWRLTTGSRWRLAALLGVQLGAILLVALLLVIVVGVLVLAVGTHAERTVTQFVLVPIAVVAMMIIFAVVPAAAYVALRITRHGGMEGVEEVFA